MKKLLFLVAGFFLLLTGCGSDDDSSEAAQTIAQTFSVDNNNYSLLPMQGLTEGKMEDVYTFNGIAYTRSQVSVVGMIGFATTATVSFDLYYKSNMSIARTYPIYDNVADDDNFDEYMVSRDRACMGWTTWRGSRGPSCSSRTTRVTWTRR